eukprot:6207813-Pleurochrysis_carterae.AAC.1
MEDVDGALLFMADFFHALTSAEICTQEAESSYTGAQMTVSLFRAVFVPENPLGAVLCDRRESPDASMTSLSAAARAVSARSESAPIEGRAVVGGRIRGDLPASNGGTVGGTNARRDESGVTCGR